jgi:tetratricopeptide (TPR) repeat protein
MTTTEILEKIREGLTGEYNVDMVYLEAEADKYKNHKNGKEICDAIADMAYETMPADKREILNRMMYIDGKRLDVVHAEAQKLIQEKKIEESFRLTEALYTKIRMNYRETEKEVYLSLRNTLEHQLYLYFYRPSKKLVKPVFDLSQMILLHGYNLLELNRPEEAARVINDAIRYNPMNTDAYFELAECYKALKDPKQLLSVTKETIEIAVTPVQLSRCYCNLGFYCVEVKDYDRAVCFYYESLIYADHPMVPAELHHIHTITQKKITPPTREEVEEVFEHYHMHPGANQEVVSVISSLAQESIENKELPAIRFYLHMLHGLTNNPEVKEMMDRYDLLAKERKQD